MNYKKSIITIITLGLVIIASIGGAFIGKNQAQKIYTIVSTNHSRIVLDTTRLNPLAVQSIYDTKGQIPPPVLSTVASVATQAAPIGSKPAAVGSKSDKKLANKYDFSTNSPSSTAGSAAAMKAALDALNARSAAQGYPTCIPTGYIKINEYATRTICDWR